MTEQHILELLFYYESQLKYFVNIIEYNSDLEYCRTMINPMRAMVYEKQFDKLNRWLGFLQGVFWSNGLFTIDQMRNHNKDYESFAKEIQGSTHD
jgi:hypothetical protein